MLGELQVTFAHLELGFTLSGASSRSVAANPASPSTSTMDLPCARDHSGRASHWGALWPPTKPFFPHAAFSLGKGDEEEWVIGGWGLPSVRLCPRCWMCILHMIFGHPRSEDHYYCQLW